MGGAQTPDEGFMASLFDRPTQAPRRESPQCEPLAARMRPRTLDEFWGQAHILAKGRLLRRAIEADRLSSVIFYGPPGTGKTTLARIIANTTQAKFLSLNAVLSGIKEIRESIDSAKQSYDLVGRKSILFVDEVHRFNKSQQDALLPWVENGTITLIGATTENPYFEVNKALVSRSRVFQLMPLTDADLRGIVMQALRDEERGFGLLPVIMHDAALAHLVDVANGDARALLNALELAVTTTEPSGDGQIVITLAVAEESIQQRAVLYDKEGDAHFDTISAFIKSIRGSDPDAALYWLARMVVAGESPNFIFRRLLISACEDVGLADPHAVEVVAACAQAFDRIGLPEGRYHLAHATLYLATAPKSNSSMAFFDALAVVEKETSYDIPNPLKDASRDKEGLGHGAGYLYPHAYRDHWVAQQYLPAELQGRVFFHPSDMGYERQIAEKVARNREAQLAAYEDAQAHGESSEDRWIGRTFDGKAARAQALRDIIFDFATLAPNSRVLDIGASSGLLSFEALRRCPQGGVFAIVGDDAASSSFVALNEKRDEIDRIQIKKIDDFANFMPDLFGDQLFDFVTGRNFLDKHVDIASFFRRLNHILDNGGKYCFCNIIPSMQPKISSLIPDEAKINSKLIAAWRDAESKVYASTIAPDIDMTAIEAAATRVQLTCNVRHVELPGALTITPSIFNRWFSHQNDRHSYIDQIGEYLNRESCDAITQFAHVYLRGQSMAWPAHYAIVYGERKTTPSS